MSEVLPEGAYPSMMTDVVITPEASAQSLIRDYCGWHVAPVITETITVNGSGTHHLALPTLKIKELLGVSIDGVAVDLASIQWDEGGILYRSGSLWPKGPRRITVSMTHGFNPENVAWIVKQIADRVGGNVPPGVERVTVGQRSVTYRDTAGITQLMSNEKAALLPYKIERKAY